MNKSVIITGPQCSGKTTKARKIASEFKDFEVLYIYSRNFNILENPFIFENCTQKTKLIVFEELSYRENFLSILNIASNPIFVNKRGENSFYIQPKFIIVSQFDFNELLELGTKMFRNFESRILKNFDVIRCER